MKAAQRSLTGIWWRVRRAVLLRRRLLAASCAVLAVLLGLQAARPPQSPTRLVSVVARDLDAGTTLTATDLQTRSYDPDLVPSGVVTDPVGRVLAVPVRAGEPVVDRRLVDASPADGYPGRVAVPVRFSDAAMVALLGAGDRIDVLAVDPRSGAARLLSVGVPVLSVPEPTAAEALPGALVILAVPVAARAEVVAAGVRDFLTFGFSD